MTTQQLSNQPPKVFGGYADFYDTYYADKDYAKEADYVVKLASQLGRKPSSLLDMGCGTGRHLEHFAQAGLQCDGFDRSAHMLVQAKERLAGSKVRLSKGDLTTFRNGKRYDLVVSMFAVMGYLTDNEQLIAGLETATAHMKRGGLFIFDGWFGPAVLSEVPTVRKHSYAVPEGRITRRAEPMLDPVGQTVSVKYIVEQRKGSKFVRRTMEEHRMRFFFVQEVALAAQSAGMRLVHACPFLVRDGKLTTKTWNVSLVLKRQ